MCRNRYRRAETENTRLLPVGILARWLAPESRTMPVQPPTRRRSGENRSCTKRAQKIAPQDGCHFVEQAFHIIGSSSPRTRRCDLVRRSSGNRKSAIPRLLYFEFFGKPLTSRSATLQQNLRLRLLLESCAW